jgi:hypothetical protein
VAYLQVTTNAFKNSPSKHDIASKISMPTPSTSISPKPSDHIEFKSIVGKNLFYVSTCSQSKG